MLVYKGYHARAAFDEEVGIYHGETTNTVEAITFACASFNQLQKAFRDAIEDYLAFCDEHGKEPEKPFSNQSRIGLALQGV